MTASTTAAPTTAASILVALFSSLTAYLLGAVVLPSLLKFIKRDRALKKLNLPTPKPTSFLEQLLGTMCRCDPVTPSNYCRTAIMGEWFEELGGSPPVLVTRGLERHLVVIVDAAAATSVSFIESDRERRERERNANNEKNVKKINRSSPAAPTSKKAPTPTTASTSSPTPKGRRTS